MIAKIKKKVLKMNLQLNPIEKTYFLQLFQLADSDKDGFVSTSDVNIYRRTKLPDSVLGQVK
jgi:Ca2+-binding EF-hand superfamily protein